MSSIVGSRVVHGGRVSVLGLPAGSPKLRATVGYTTQSPSVYGDLTVRRNLAYFSALAGSNTEAINAVLSEVGLTSTAKRLAPNLSGGQLGRVSLACALVGDPKVLVVDEPTVGLDPVLREGIWDGLRARADDGATILVSSHVMDEANRCDDLVLLRGVDPRTVRHHFGDKAGLYLAVARVVFDPRRVLRRVLGAGRNGFGRRVLRVALTTWESPAGSTLACALAAHPALFPTLTRLLSQQTAEAIEILLPDVSPGERAIRIANDRDGPRRLVHPPLYRSPGTVGIGLTRIPD